MEIETTYHELRRLVQHGQKQGFVAGIIFSGGIMLARPMYTGFKTGWNNAMTKHNTPKQ
jgi:hypothetical protein